jgi:hypothetical protein
MIDACWPAAPAAAVFHGPAGEFVLRTEPHTESHPMALLSQFLVAFGTATGRNAHYTVEASRHHANEFIVLVGASAKGRICRARHMRAHVAHQTMLRQRLIDRAPVGIELLRATYFGRVRGSRGTRAARRARGSAPASRPAVWCGRWRGA